ncbi:MAG: gamma-glutamylcyclotransferase family protein [Opitutaceae bacterium]
MQSEYTVFVYGTLKPGGHYWSRFCEGKVSRVVPAKIRGSLYDLNVGYPGLVLDDRSWVLGCILTLPRMRDFLKLDMLEGYDETRDSSLNEYTRLKVPCFGPKGETLGDHWTYEMTPSTQQKHECTLIESGDWIV